MVNGDYEIFLGDVGTEINIYLSEDSDVNMVDIVSAELIIKSPSGEKNLYTMSKTLDSNGVECLQYKTEGSEFPTAGNYLCQCKLSTNDWSGYSDIFLIKVRNLL